MNGHRNSYLLSMHRIMGEIRLGTNSASGVMTKRVTTRALVITREQANIMIF